MRLMGPRIPQEALFHVGSGLSEGSSRHGRHFEQQSVKKLSQRLYPRCADVVIGNRESSRKTMKIMEPHYEALSHRTPFHGNPTILPGFLNAATRGYYSQGGIDDLKHRLYCILNRRLGVRRRSKPAWDTHTHTHTKKKKSKRRKEKKRRKKKERKRAGLLFAVVVMRQPPPVAV
ncbi:hypothetical protein VUR80DRAFT_3627 [Thermomyces stellatus]